MASRIHGATECRDRRRSVCAALSAFAVPGLWFELASAIHAESRPKIGELWFIDAVTVAPFLNAFRQGLRELGYVDGRNVEIIARYADGDPSRLPALLAELVALRVDVLFMSPRALELAKRGATTIPVVTAGFTDPIAEGFAASLAKPGGNFTGLSWQSSETIAKRLELVREVLSELRTVGLLYDQRDPQPVVEANVFKVLARRARLTVQIFDLPASTQDRAFLEAITRGHPQALFSIDSPRVIMLRDAICQFALARGTPLFAEAEVLAKSGAILSFGADGPDLYRRGASYVDRILKGAKPGDLPIEQPTKFKLIVNLKTARAVQINIPDSILLRADEVLR